MGRKVYTEEFKQQVLADSYEKNEVTMVAKKYGIHPSTLHKWKRQQKAIEDDTAYTRDYKKAVIKTKLLKKYTAKKCSQIFKVPEYLVTFWEQELGSELMEEIRTQRYIKKRRVFVHATSHSGYWK